jgi:nucleoside-diphosphate-sugar epimerase
MARIFITGSTDGLGRLAAQSLMEDGHQVILHGRSRERAKAVGDLVSRSAGMVVGDLASAAETRKIAEQVNAIGRMDAVIHNAGIYNEPARNATPEGHARILAVNTLAPYMLTALIEKPQRLIYLSSGLHRSGGGSLRDIDWKERRWDTGRAYSESKLYIAALAFAVARHWPERVLENRETGSMLKQQAVLFRTSHHSGPLEVELARRNIPFVKFGGLKFLDASHIKDILALLRFVENPRDRAAGFRLLQLLPGIGPAGAQKILDQTSGAADPILSLGAIAPPRGCDDWTGFVDLVTTLQHGRAGWPAELDSARCWYEPYLERIHEDATMRRADIIQLEQIAAGYPSRERFLTELALDPPDATSDQAGVPHLDEDYLILSTIHSAKGQEWKSVFVLNVVDGCIPSDLGTGTSSEIEEERRLLYVAMTRARDHLHLIVPQRFFTHGQNALGDRHVYASRTRFIPDALLDRFEKLSWPVAAAETPRRRAPTNEVRIDVGARMRAMWR